jgi:hypothetical protein
MWNSIVYKSINILKSKNTLSIANSLSLIPNHNRIIDHIYLGNLNSAHNEEFLKDENIGAILNCTVSEEFHHYFFDRSIFSVGAGLHTRYTHKLRWRAAGRRASAQHGRTPQSLVR